MWRVQWEPAARRDDPASSRAFGVSFWLCLTVSCSGRFLKGPGAETGPSSGGRQAESVWAHRLPRLPCTWGSRRSWPGGLPGDADTINSRNTGECSWRACPGIHAAGALSSVIFWNCPSNCRSAPGSRREARPVSHCLPRSGARALQPECQ